MTDTISASAALAELGIVEEVVYMCTLCFCYPSLTCAAVTLSAVEAHNAHSLHVIDRVLTLVVSLLCCFMSLGIHVQVPASTYTTTPAVTAKSELASIEDLYTKVTFCTIRCSVIYLLLLVRENTCNLVLY